MAARYPSLKRVMAPAREPEQAPAIETAPAIQMAPITINPTFDQVNCDHIHIRFPWETTAKVLRSRIKQTDDGRYLYLMLSDVKGMKMEAICSQLVDHFDNQLQVGVTYVFKRVEFEPAGFEWPFKMVIPSEFIIRLREKTEIHIAGAFTFIPRLPQWFTDFSSVYGLQNKMIADVIGLVVYVSKYMYKIQYDHNIPCLDVAVMNTRREIIFVRIWDQHVRQHITRWKRAEDGLWTLAATMLEKQRAEGGLSTTDDSHIVFGQPCYQLEAFRATLVSPDAARRSLSNQVRQAVNIRNVLARNDNIVVSTL